MAKKSALREWLGALLFAVITVILIRGFLFEAFTIPTPSMEKSLLVGDFVIVSKVTYGPRMVRTPLSIPFIHQKIPFSEKHAYLDWFKIPYYRLKGYSEIQVNDVLVFNYPLEDQYPVDQRTHYVKRCVAIAGDTLEIKLGKIFIDGKESKITGDLQFNYHVKTNKNGLNADSLSDLGITEGGLISTKGDYSLSLSRKNAEKIRAMKDVESVEIFCEKKGVVSDYIFPHNENYKWNIDNFGPLKIPKAGDTVVLTMANLPLYKRIIDVYEANDLGALGDSIFINGNLARSYIFKMNYYFAMGDNRHNSADSRFWGFIPEDHIVGKATLIVTSIDKRAGKIRWDRCFKRID